MIHDSAMMNFQSDNNDEPDFADCGAEYGYEECIPSATAQDSPERVPSPGLMVHWNEGPSVSLARPCPMPADRLARKQRSFSRRGGVGHSQLLKSAVMAAMDALDSEDESRAGRRGSAVSAASKPEKFDATTLTSPRKRARLVGAKAKDRDVDVASASILLAALTTGDAPSSSSKEPVRGVPRRTSRRTSYGSKISDISDCDESYAE